MNNRSIFPWQGWQWLAAALFILAHAPCAFAASSFDSAVLEEADLEGPSHQMMNRYLLRHVDQAFNRWGENYEQIESAQDIARRQAKQREFFLDQLGGLPERTPLNARVTGQIQQDGYLIEKVVFESQPQHYVSAALYLPDSEEYSAPYPGVLVPCGHSSNGKGYEGYQKACALLALNGMAALIFDPIDQGERYQLLDDEGNPRIGGTKGHTMIGVGSILLGYNTARYEIWDGMRGIDYLQSRPEIDSDLIGCMGNSGGGTQTAFLMALDDRIRAASPSCYITRFDRLLHTIGAQDAEQNIYSQIAFGMDHADYLTMRAPMPVLICAATQDFFDIEGTWTSFRYAKRLYSRMGYSERINLIENDAEHGYRQPLREAAVQWMSRWLLGEDRNITEPEDLQALSDSEIQCTPEGQVMLLDDARSVYDLNIAAETRFAEQRRRIEERLERDEWLARIRQLTGIRPLAELPRPNVNRADQQSTDAWEVQSLILRPEEGIALPGLLFRPDSDSVTGLNLYLHEEGKAAVVPPDGPVAELLEQGRIVLAIDVRGNGETKQTEQSYLKPFFGTDGQDVYAAYLLGKSYVGMRAEDILVAARWLLHESDATPDGRGVDLITEGNLGVPALHAAALEPDLFQTLELKQSLYSWSNVIHERFTDNQLINAVHGALRHYDLPALAKLLGDKLTLTEPVDAKGEPMRREE